MQSFHHQTYVMFVMDKCNVKPMEFWILGVQYSIVKQQGYGACRGWIPIGIYHSPHLATPATWNPIITPRKGRVLNTHPRDPNGQIGFQHQVHRVWSSPLPHQYMYIYIIIYTYNIYIYIFIYNTIYDHDKSGPSGTNNCRARPLRNQGTNMDQPISPTAGHMQGATWDLFLAGNTVRP